MIKRGNALLALIFIIVLVLTGYYIILYLKDSSQKSRESSVTTNVKFQDNVDEYIEFMVQNPATKETKLKHVGSGELVGVAYTLRENGKITHLIKTTLSVPAEGSFYEGWLFEKESDRDYFSTGILEKLSDGSYASIMSADDEYAGFDHVVISKEAGDDEVAETHILEGYIQ